MVVEARGTAEVTFVSPRNLTRAMSRETQSTRRTRTPSISNPLPNPLNYPTSLPTTRPLQIARPSTPTNAAFSSPKAPPFSSPNRPHRPQRSDLRPRQPSDYSASERTSTSSRIVNDLNTRERRDSSSTTLSDASIQHRPIGSISLPTKPRLDLPRSGTIELSASPTLSSTTASPALSAAMAAFRDAGETNLRRRELANGNDEGNYELERRSEVEREKARQERIKERMPYRKPTAKGKTGEIDGQFKALISYSSRTRPQFTECTLAILDQIRDEWEFVIDPDVSMVAHRSGRVVQMLMTSASSTT